MLPTTTSPAALPAPHPRQVPANVCQTPASAHLALDTVHPAVRDPLRPPAADRDLQLLPAAVCDQVCAAGAV